MATAMFCPETSPWSQPQKLCPRALVKFLDPTGDGWSTMVDCQWWWSLVLYSMAIWTRKMDDGTNKLVLLLILELCPFPPFCLQELTFHGLFRTLPLY